MRRPSGKKNRPFTQRRMEELLAAEKKVTGEWYRMMSGETPWGYASRAEYQRLFDDISGEVRALQAEEAAEWFSGLPSAVTHLDEKSCE
jgi:hypothetical protein